MSTIIDQQQQFSFNSQAALVYYIEEILAKWNSEYGNKGLLSLDSRKQGTFQQANYKNFHCVRTTYEMGTFPNNGGPDIQSVIQTIFFSSLGKSKDFSILFSKFSSTLRDSITCNVEIYKTFIVNGREYDWLVPLNEGGQYNFQEGRQKKSLEISTEKKDHTDVPLGNNVAISSFNFEYKGTNDFEAETNLEASLELKFGDPTKLLEKINTNAGENSNRFNFKPLEINVTPEEKAADVDKNLYFSFSDLISNVPSDYKPNQIDINNYRIKAVVSFDTSLTEESFNKKNADQKKISDAIKQVVAASADNDPSVINAFSVTDDIGFKDFSTFRAVLKKCSTYLYLTPVSHDITIDQNNFFTIKINYIASGHGLLSSSKSANILNIASRQMEELNNANKALEAIREAINKVRSDKITEQKISDDSSKDEEKLKKIDEQIKTDYKDLFERKEIYERQISIAKSSVYSGVIRKIINDNLYRIQIPNESLGVRIDISNVSDETGGDFEVRNAEVEKTSVITNRKTITSFIKYPNTDLQDAINLKLNNTVVGLSAAEASALMSQFGIGDWTKENLDAKIKAFDEILKKGADLDTLENSKTAQTISFFFLGDLLDTILECLNTIEPKTSRPVLLFGDITITLPKSITPSKDKDGKEINTYDNKTITFNIADIPISFNLLTKFWTSLIESKPDYLTVHTFFYELIERLLKPVLGPKYLEQFNVANKLRINSSTISLPNISLQTDVLTNTTPDTRKGPIDTKLALERYQALMNNKDYSKLGTDNGITTYICFYDGSSTMAVEQRKGDPDKDATDGIYHFSLNTGDSIIKKISFSKVDMQGMREGLAVQEGSNKSAIAFKQAYKVEVQLYPGLTVYKPGDMIFVDPYLFVNEKVFNLTENNTSISNVLGFVGYYLITSTSYSMSKTSIPTATLNGRLHAWINASGKAVSIKGN